MEKSAPIIDTRKGELRVRAKELVEGSVRAGLIENLAHWTDMAACMDDLDEVMLIVEEMKKNDFPKDIRTFFIQRATSDILMKRRAGRNERRLAAKDLKKVMAKRPTPKVVEVIEEAEES